MSETTAEMSTDEQLARALLTLVEVESVVEKLEGYLTSNGEYLDIDVRVPLDHSTEALRAALDKWKAAPSPAALDRTGASE